MVRAQHRYNTLGWLSPSGLCQDKSAIYHYLSKLAVFRTSFYDGVKGPVASEYGHFPFYLYHGVSPQVMSSAQFRNHHVGLDARNAGIYCGPKKEAHDSKMVRKAFGRCLLRPPLNPNPGEEELFPRVCSRGQRTHLFRDRTG